jgi:rhamnulose-1-phosphate aldolase/alcohol dehydrogenase
MKSRWDDEDARQAVNRWGGEHGEAYALRLYTAHLIGQDPALVLHGGGNVSVKATRRTVLGDEVEVIHVKGSGRDLAILESRDLCPLDLTYLRRLRLLSSLTDDEMVGELRTHLFDASAPVPSIETLLHVFLPHRYVDHSHADAVLAVANQPKGEEFVREALGDRAAIVPYVRPGFELAKAAADCYQAHPDVEGVVLLHHGLITFGDDARTAYERHIALVDACERFIERRAVRGNARSPASRPSQAHPPHAPAELAIRVAPVLRGLLAAPSGDEDRPYLRSILEWRASDEVESFLETPEARALVHAGPLTGDHLVHTKPKPMFVEDLRWSDDEALRRQLCEAVQTYRRDYEAYLAAHGGSTSALDSSPRVVLLPGAGMFCWGRTKRDARITADIAEHTLSVKAKAQAVGRYTGLPPDHWFDMEHRAIQRAKLHSTADRPLESQVVVISGGAGAIGSAIAEVCAEAGAHVVVADLDEDRMAAVVQHVEQRCVPGAAFGVVMDVTDEGSVRSAFEQVVKAYGGVDVIVPNAGIAHVAAIEDMLLDDFRRVMEVNAVGYLLVMREGIRILKRQGLGGHIVVNASKNVFAPGKDFGAYSASKAAGHQLGKVAAIELAPYGIRVNMINADAIFGDAETPSGLWATVGPGRAKGRNIKEEELAEYYRGRNLLKARVHGRHVGRAVVFFASNATPTTGATLPVDGGLIEAFPR